ncbi:MAG: type II secretion system F family protein, partial [Candidatus Hydrogenedentales bacterium]
VYHDFLRQLIMLLDAGTSLLKSLTILSERSEQRALRELVVDITRYVESGNALWQAFERHPHEFDPVFVNLIRAGEASGTVTTVLRRLVKYRENREMMRRRLAGAMWYPAILVLVCGLVLLLIAKVVIPEFQELFTRLGQPLPWYTTAFIDFVTFISSAYFVVPVIVALVVLYALYRIWVRSPLNRLRADRCKLMIPVVGKSILRKSAVVQFTRSLSLLLRSGISMMVTLDLVRGAIQNQAMAQVMQRIRDSVERGEGIEQPLRDAKSSVPAVLTDMLVTGEESGQLEQIAEHVADTYEEEVNIAIGTLGELLQPILTIVIGVMVMILFAALFVPMISMLDGLMAAGAGSSAGA